MKNEIKNLVGIVLASFTLYGSFTYAEISEKDFFEKRKALIIKHSHNDKTIATLKAQVKKGDAQSAEYWRWRIDQYLYGQYPEYQAIYNAYTEGKPFNKIYALPPENLGPKKPVPTRLPKLPEGYFTDNLLGNAYTGWHDLVGNKVYVVYQGHLTDPYVASYDLKNQKWDGPYKAGDSTLSKGERKIDSHGRPVIEQDTKGYFHVIFGGHGGEREDGLNPLSIDTPHAGGRMLHAVSEKPNDISRFVIKDDITPFASYTSSHKMANGDIYLFTRAGTHKSPWLLYKMKSGNQTFEKPVILTWPTVQHDDPIHVDTHYINPQKISDTEIAISYLWHTCNFNEVHNKQNYGRLNAYYMKLDTTNGNFYNVKNEKLTLPITIPASQIKTLAYDSVKTKETSFGTKPLKLKDGTPAVAYEARGPGYREWRMAAYNEGKWTHSLPMPGTKNRTLKDKQQQVINNIVELQVINENDGNNKGVAVYKDNKNQTVFASVIRDNVKSQDWRVEETYFGLTKARVRMELVKKDSGNAVAVILNVRRGASQRLYLWQDGKMRPNTTL